MEVKILGRNKLESSKSSSEDFVKLIDLLNFNSCMHYTTHCLCGADRNVWENNSSDGIEPNKYWLLMALHLKHKTTNIYTFSYADHVQSYNVWTETKKNHLIDKLQ